jgi:L-lactate dehydrogenase complex protein LldE
MTAQLSAVQLFATGFVETLKPEAGRAVVKVLERLGLTVEYPDRQTCCGQPAFNGGAWYDARGSSGYPWEIIHHR